jgi:very-short-patch-repair endonuclease
VIPQHEVRAGGLLLHPDLVDPLRGVVVEAGSWRFHASRYEHDRDCVRHNALVATDWQVMRFTHDHVMGSASYVVSTIRQVAEAAA